MGLRDKRRRNGSSSLKDKKKWQVNFSPLGLGLFYRLSNLCLVKLFSAQGDRRRLRRAPRGCIVLHRKDFQDHRVRE